MTAYRADGGTSGLKRRINGVEARDNPKVIFGADIFSHELLALKRSRAHLGIRPANRPVRLPPPCS